jgi:hypothetical protein
MSICLNACIARSSKNLPNIQLISRFPAMQLDLYVAGLVRRRSNELRTKALSPFKEETEHSAVGAHNKLRRLSTAGYHGYTLSTCRRLRAML